MDVIHFKAAGGDARSLKQMLAEAGRLLNGIDTALSALPTDGRRIKLVAAEEPIPISDPFEVTEESGFDLLFRASELHHAA